MEFKQEQTMTGKCKPELVRMVRNASSNAKEMDTLEFIKIEDGQMQCLICQNIFTDKETHQRQCSERSDKVEGHIYINAIDEGPKMNVVPLPETSHQLSRCTGIKVELPEFDNSCTEIKIEPTETNTCTSLADNPTSSTKSEDLMQCLNCKLYFNDRYAYLDHKMFSCNESFDQLTDVGLNNSVDTVESFETPNKTELQDKAQTSERGPINIEIPYDQDMSSFEMVNPQPPKFTCSCTICDAVFDDFFIFDIHTKVCKRPGIGTVIEDLNLSKTKCAICKENFQSILDLSKHMVSTHVGGNAKWDAKKRKHAETDFNEYTWQSPATIARGLTRNVNRIRCYFGTCVETFVTLSDFKSHYTMHLQCTRTSTKQNEQASVNVAAFREIAAHRLQKECKLLLGKHETEKNKSNGDRLDMNKQIPRRDFEGYTFLNNASKSDNGSDDIYKCPKDGCANSFLSKQAVQRRTRVQKTYNLVFANGKQVHQCQYKGCGRLFDTRKLLKDHNQATHMNKKLAFQCLYKSCGRSFDTKKLLTEHIQDIHIDSVRKCKSKRLPHYTLYTCTLCLNTFQSKDVVFKHLHEVHRVIGTINSNLYAVENLLLCSVCKRYVGLYSFLEHSKRCQKKISIETALNQHLQEIVKPGNEADIEHQFKQTKGIGKHRSQHDDKSTEQDIVEDYETHTTKHDKSTEEEINANNGDHCTQHDDKATEQESRSSNGGNYTKHGDKLVEQGIKTENDEIFTKYDDRLTENDKTKDNDERHAKHDDHHERYTKHDKSNTNTSDDKLTDQEMEKSDAKKLSKIISSGAYEYWQDYLQRLIEIRDKYMCNICTLTFCYKNEILTHLVKTHGVQDRFSENMTYVGIAHGCKLCRFAFPQQHVIWGHLVSMHAVLDSEPALETCSKVTGKICRTDKRRYIYLSASWGL